MDQPIDRSGPVRAQLRNVSESILVRPLSASEEQAGPFYLLSDCRHPLVRAEARGVRAKNIWTAAVCAAVPLGVFFGLTWLQAEGGLTLGPWGGNFEPTAAVFFVSFWPTVCFLGAALRSAGAVIAERDRGTAEALTLTLVPKRAIAAAKILPHVWPFLVGIVATLPLYVWTGPSFVMDKGFPAFWLVWPLRWFSPLMGEGTLELALGGSIVGALMCLLDVMLVWAAVHWGAGYGVRLGGIMGTMLYLLGRLLLLVPVLVGFMFGAIFCGLLLAALFGGLILLTRSVTSVLGTGFSRALEAALDTGAPLVIVGGAVVVFWLLLHRFTVSGAVRMALREFAGFDRLASDEFRPRWMGWPGSPREPVRP